MAEKVGSDMFEVYSKASRAWMDALGSWSKTAAGASPMGKGMDMEGLFRPYWDFIERWNKTYNSYAGMMNAAFSFTTMRDTGDVAAKSMSSYTRIYNTWLEGMGAVTREIYEVGRKASAGEKVEMEKFLKALSGVYDNVSTRVMESLQDTPFAGMKDIEAAMKRSLDSFPEEQKAFREFLEEVVNVNSVAMHLSTSTMKQTTEGLSRILEKGTLSGNGHGSLAEAFEESLREAAETLRAPSISVPGYKEITERAIVWRKANVDLCVSWLEMNLKLYQGITGSTQEISKAGEEMFKEGKISSADEFYKKWGEARTKATETMLSNSQFYQNVPAFITSYTEWIKATNDFCRAIMTAPYASREDLERLSEELEKLKKSAEKKAKSRPEEAKVED
ncbi:MAG: hypothetical protein HY671_01085 [Chloroflexi bacterium]|nr:hypothetical protein [Chloroflexota bacterium]